LRDPEFSSEDIHRPDRKNAEADIGPRNPVGDFIDRPVPARGNNRLESLIKSLAGQFECVSGFRGHP